MNMCVATNMLDVVVVVDKCPQYEKNWLTPFGARMVYELSFVHLVGEHRSWGRATPSSRFWRNVYTHLLYIVYREGSLICAQKLYA